LDPKFIQELKKTRLEKKITLLDISSATRINIRFLDAIERGELEVLPKPYIRSFIKQYAQHVGADVPAVMAKFEEYQRGLRPHAEIPKEPESDTASIPAIGADHRPRLKLLSLSLVAIGIIALIIYFFLYLSGTQDGPPVTERPFQDVIREMEEQAENEPTEPVGTPSIIEAERRDSVSLEVTVLDTVWLTIMLDNSIQEEYIFPPGRRREWKAANQLLLTVGNAGGISVTVNDDSIGLLGMPGQVVRNLQITRDGIQR
jgi:cytoskeleton protein RodZ